MKFLLNMMDRLRPAFHTGPLKAVRPAFDAMDSFLFSVPDRVGLAPHVRGPDNIKRYMSAVIIALMPIIAASIYFFGWRVVAMIVVTYVAGLSVELIFAMIRKEEINEGFFVTGLLYPLILPPGMPLWLVALGIVFGVIVGKELYGGTGRNPFNPALVARCFLLIGYPAAMSAGWALPASGWPGGFARWLTPLMDAKTQATPLAAAKQGTFADWHTLLLGNCTGSAGETSAVLILAAGAFLIVCGVVNWRTVAGLLGSFAGLLGILAWASPASFGRMGWDPASVVGWNLLAGGLLFGAIFMATDPVTSPMSNLGKWGYGIIIGVSTILIRFLTGYVEGIMFAILLGNIAAPLLDEVATRAYLRRVRHEG